MDINERVLNIVKEKGPLLPVQIAKEINDNILMTSARLSELLSNKRIKISKIKVGGSPLYYFQGQENKLQEYSHNLVEKEKQAYEILKKNKLLKDSEQEPAIRVALRQIKDFSIPLQVTYQNKKEIFWKWYLIGNSEAESILKTLIAKKEIITKDKTQDIEKEIKENIQEKEPLPQPQRFQETIRKPIHKQEILKTTEKPREITKKETKQTDKDSFLDTINNFFTKNRLEIIEKNEIKKYYEINFITLLETSIGKVKYFCKTKKQKENQ